MTWSRSHSKINGTGLTVNSRDRPEERFNVSLQVLTKNLQASSDRPKVRAEILRRFRDLSSLFSSRVTPTFWLRNRCE